MEGGTRCYYGNSIKLDKGTILTEPEGGCIDGTDIRDSNGNSAKRAVIEPKPPVILGDIDGDGEATILDATLAQRYATRVAIPYDEAHVNKSGDVDGEGEVTALDATFIQRYATRVKVPYPIGEPIY